MKILFQMIFLLSIPVGIGTALLFHWTMRKFRRGLKAEFPNAWDPFFSKSLRSFRGVSYHALLATRDGSFFGHQLSDVLLELRKSAVVLMYWAMGSFLASMASLFFVEVAFA